MTGFWAGNPSNAPQTPTFSSAREKSCEEGPASVAGLREAGGSDPNPPTHHTRQNGGGYNHYVKGVVTLVCDVPLGGGGRR